MNQLKPLIIVALAVSLTVSAISAVSAQGPSKPPSAFRGTVTSPDGPVATGLAVEAYVGETLCNNRDRETYSTTSGVTEYFVAVLSDASRGCDGEIRFVIGGRAATQTGSHGGGAITRLNLTLATAAPESVTVDVTVWQSLRTGNIFVSTRPEGAGWTTHNTPVDLSALSGSGNFYQGTPVPVEVDLGGGTTVNIDVTVWRSVRTGSHFVSTRPEGAGWTTFNTPIDLSQLSGSGNFYQGTPVTVEVDLQ